MPFPDFAWLQEVHPFDPCPWSAEPWHLGAERSDRRHRGRAAAVAVGATPSDSNDARSP